MKNASHTDGRTEGPLHPDCSVTAYDEWWKQADRKWIRRSPYSHKWKLWGQMPILALRMGWMACEAWYRLKRKSPNSADMRNSTDATRS